MVKPARACAECGRNLPRKAHPNRKFCERCRPTRKPTTDPEPVREIISQLNLAETYLGRDDPGDVPGFPGEFVGPISAATEIAIDAADHLTAKDKGAVQVLRFLAKKLDTEDLLRDKILQWQEMAGEQPKLPPFDNTSMPTYLNFAAQLGLTPAGRRMLPPAQGLASGKKTKLAVLRDNAKAAG